MDMGAIVAAIIAIVGVIVWSAKQQGRIDRLDEALEAHEKLTNVKLAERERYDIQRAEESDRRHRENKEALERIERKMDSYCEYFVRRGPTNG